MKHPDAKKHLAISLFKSAMRITACVYLFNSDFSAAAIWFGLAEILGIFEELV